MVALVSDHSKPLHNELVAAAQAYADLHMDGFIDAVSTLEACTMMMANVVASIPEAQRASVIAAAGEKLESYTATYVASGRVPQQRSWVAP